MKRGTLIVITLGLASMLGGCAAEGVQKMSIQKALSDTRANAGVSKDIRLSFGDSGSTGHEYTTIKRTNGANKEMDEACNRAFLSAVIALQDRAIKEGKKSVVDIYSFHKRNKFSSSTQFECEDGKIMNAVTLRGKVR